VRQRIIDSPRIFIILFFTLLVISVFAIYYPSLSVPFYLDDRQSIFSNLAIQSPTMDLLIQGPNRMRIIGYWSLWLNYQIGGLEPFGYHVMNIVIHIINSMLVYVLSYQLLRHFCLSLEPQKLAKLRIWAFIIMVIWALHPLNSQSVVYIVQRLASIATLFYLATIICYIQARKSKKSTTVLVYSLLTAVSILAGLHAKQNFVTVFVFILGWELFTAQERLRVLLMRILIVTAIITLIAAPFMTDILQALDNFTRDHNAPSRIAYFYSQQLVLWDYIIRFFYPINLQLDIEVQLRSSLEPIVALASMGHMMLIVAAIKLRKKLPLFFIGIMFFYIAHGVESFMVPLKDLAFEHRTYTGNVGLVIAVIALVKYWFDNTSNFLAVRWVALTVVTVLLIYGSVVVKRNILWQDPLAFYANEVRLSPQHARANASYGNELMKRQQYAEAEKYIKKSVDISLASGQITATALTAFMTVLYHQEKYQQASHVVMLGLRNINYPPDRSALLSGLAFGYIKMGFCDFAIGLLNTALQLDSSNAEAKNNLAYCMAKKNNG
jgi:hypothetical protein